MAKKKKCRHSVCANYYVVPSFWSGCCSEECLAKRKSFLNNRRPHGNFPLPNLTKKKINKKKLIKVNYEFDFQSERWLKLRYVALKKYGRKCQCCGAKPPNAIIQVDHIKPRSLHSELTWDINNLQILCKECNFGKSNLDETDFRPEE